jgi:hypothetical protein
MFFRDITSPSVLKEKYELFLCSEFKLKNMTIETLGEIM